MSQDIDQWGCRNLFNNWSWQFHPRAAAFSVAWELVPHLDLYLLKFEWLIGICVNLILTTARVVLITTLLFPGCLTVFRLLLATPCEKI